MLALRRGEERQKSGSGGSPVSAFVVALRQGACDGRGKAQACECSASRQYVRSLHFFSDESRCHHCCSYSHSTDSSSFVAYRMDENMMNVNTRFPSGACLGEWRENLKKTPNI